MSTSGKSSCQNTTPTGLIHAPCAGFGLDLVEVSADGLFPPMPLGYTTCDRAAEAIHHIMKRQNDNQKARVRFVQTPKIHGKNSSVRVKNEASNLPAATSNWSESSRTTYGGDVTNTMFEPWFPPSLENKDWSRCEHPLCAKGQYGAISFRSE